MLQLADLQLRGAGFGQPCVLSWTSVCSAGEARQVLLLPLLSREGGFLCAVPADLHAEVVTESEAPLPNAALGPARLASVPAVEEDEAGEEIPAGLDISAMLLDLELSALAYMRVFDPVTETGVVHCFVPDAPHLAPQHASLIQQARSWIGEETAERLAFYSAVEEEAPPPPKKAVPKAKRVTVNQLSEQVSALATMLPGLIDQVKSVVERQDKLEAGGLPHAPQKATSPPKPAHQQPFAAPKSSGLPVPKVTALTSPPPRTKPVELPATTSGQGLAGGAPEVDLCFGQPPSPAASLVPQDAIALLQQSQALSTLVGHLVSQQDGGLADLSSSSGVIGIGASKEGEVADRLGRAFRGLLSPGHAGSFQTAKPFSSMSQLVRRLVGTGVDVPLLRTVRGVWGASGSSLCHVALGPCSRLRLSSSTPGRTARTRDPGRSRHSLLWPGPHVRCST